MKKKSRIKNTGVRSQKSEVRSQESGVRSQESEVRSQKSEVRSQKPEARQEPTANSFKDFCWIVPFSFLLRLFLIIRSPAVYEFDGYLFLLGLTSQYPLFTGFVKILIACGFSVFIIRIVIAAIAALGSFAFFLFSRQLFKDNAIARVSTFLMIIYPSFVVFSLVPYTESLFLLIFFMGTYSFLKEHEANSKYYIKTGIFIGMACLTRYEAFLILPLIFMAILLKLEIGNWKLEIGNSKLETRNQHPKSNHKSQITNFKFLISLSWAPIVLLLYNYAVTPDLAASQSKETQNIFKELFPILDSMINIGFPNFFKEIKVRGLQFSSWVFIGACTFSVISALIAVIKDKKHLLFVIFILLATGIQLLPIASNYRDYPGRLIGLRRHGMIPAIFLILYLSYGFDLLIKQLPRKIFSKKIGYALAMLILMTAPVIATFQTNNFLITDYQKLYRGSFIQPCWVGKPGDAGTGIITAVVNRILMLRLQGRGLPLYPYQQVKAMPIKNLEAFIKAHQIKYVFIERFSFREFDNLFEKEHTRLGFQKIADVGGWLSVYALK